MSLPKPPLGPPVRRDSFAVLVVVGVAVHHLGGLLWLLPGLSGGVDATLFDASLVLGHVVHVVGVAIALVGAFRALRLLEERLRRPAAAPDAPAPDPAG